jgi:hypothetical protein
MEKKAVTNLVIDLQDGFKDDTVILRINNDEVFRKKHITTDLRISLATRFTTNINSGEVQVEVIIPTKDLIDNYKFIINSESYLGISIVESELPNKKIKFILSQEPFVYF